MALTAPERDSPGDSARGNRLDCWKEIAAYLDRSEKTVRRWEMERGLPTHRAPGGGRTAVYAYTAELDEWLNSRRAQDLDASEAGKKTSGTAAGNETTDSGRPDPPIAGPTAAPANSQPIVKTAKSQVDRHGFKPGWKPAMVLVLAAAAVCIAAFAVTRGFAGSGFSHRISSMFGATRTATIRPGSTAVSEAEKAVAHDLYLKGRYEWSQRTPDSLNRALDDFTQAVVHDPGDAQAFVGLADTYDLLREYSTMPDNDAYARATAAAEKAVELDDSLAEAHRALAFAEFWGNWDFVSAEKHFRRAIELDPKDPVARRWYANSFAVPERIAESLKQMDKAEELDPSSPATLADKGMMLFNAGKTDEAIELLEEVERSNPEFRSAHYYMMHIDLDLRKYPAFLAEGQKAAETQKDPVLKDIIASAREGYARDSGHGLLQNLYTKQREYYGSGKFRGTLLAKTCVLMGKKQEAMDLLEDAYARHESQVLVCLLDRQLLTLSDEPRFQAMIKKINFPNSTNGSPGSSPATNKSHLRASY